MSRPLAVRVAWPGLLFLTLTTVACSSSSGVTPPGVEAGVPDAGAAVDAPAGAAADAPADSAGDAAADGTAAVGLCAATPVRALAIPDTQTGLLAGTGLVPTAKCWGQTPGPDNVFTLHLAKTTGVEIHAQLEPVDTVADQTIAVTVRKRCDDGATELGCNVTRTKGQGLTVRLVLDPGDYLVVVDSFNVGVDAGPGAAFMYSMTVKEYAFAANTVCKTATVVMNGTTLMNQDTSMGVDSLNDACEHLATGKVLYYKATVPAGQTITAKSTGRSSLRLLDSCGAVTCWQSDRSDDTGAGATISWKNPGPSADVWVALGNNDAGPSGSYGVSFTVVP